MSFTIHDHRSHRSASIPSHFTRDNRIPCAARTDRTKISAIHTNDHVTFCHWEERTRTRGAKKAIRHVLESVRSIQERVCKPSYPLTHAVLEEAFPFRCICICLCELTRQRALGIPRRILISVDSSYNRFDSSLRIIWYQGALLFLYDVGTRNEFREILPGGEARDSNRENIVSSEILIWLNPSRKRKLYHTDIVEGKLGGKIWLIFFRFIIPRIRNRIMPVQFLHCKYIPQIKLKQSIFYFLLFSRILNARAANWKFYLTFFQNVFIQEFAK